MPYKRLCSQTNGSSLSIGFSPRGFSECSDYSSFVVSIDEALRE